MLVVPVHVRKREGACRLRLISSRGPVLCSGEQEDIMRPQREEPPELPKAQGGIIRNLQEEIKTLSDKTAPKRNEVRTPPYFLLQFFFSPPRVFDFEEATLKCGFSFMILLAAYSTWFYICCELDAVSLRVNCWHICPLGLKCHFRWNTAFLLPSPPYELLTN